MYELKITPKANRTFSKLSNKNPKQMNIIAKKIEEILLIPNHFKPLRGDLHGARRVHIDKSFVLMFEVDEERKTVTILDYKHHDKIYK